MLRFVILCYVTLCYVLLRYVIKGKMPALLPGQAINNIIAHPCDQLLTNEEAYCPAGR